jgi:hypothetical protein
VWGSSLDRWWEQAAKEMRERELGEVSYGNKREMANERGGNSVASGEKEKEKEGTWEREKEREREKRKK